MSGSGKLVDRNRTEGGNTASVDNGNLHVQITGSNGNEIDINTLGEIKEVNSDNILNVSNTISDTQTDGTQKTQIVSISGDVWNINDEGQAHVVMSGLIDTNNSTNATLGISAVYTGTSVDILDYSMVNLSVYSNVASATDGLSIQQSCDGTNWDITDEYTVPAGSGKTYSIQTACKYLRVSYTNGGTGQTAFRLNTLLKKNMTKPSSHRVQDTIIDDDDAELSKAVLTAKKDDGSFTNITATDSGNMKVTNAENGLAIAQGLVSGAGNIHKFGETGLLAANVITDVWDYSATEEIYTFSTSADINTVSSSDGGDGQVIKVQGFDTNWDHVIQTATLNGQAKVVLGTPLIRVYRMSNEGATDFAGNIYCYPDTNITNGVPNDTTKVRAYINDGNNQTLMAIMAVCVCKTAYLTKWDCTFSGKTTGTINVRLWYRPFGGVFQLKESVSIMGAGSSRYENIYTTPLPFSAKGDFKITAEGSANNIVCSAGFDFIGIDI